MSIVMTLSPEQRLEKAVAFLLGYPGLEAVSGLLMIGTRKVCDRKARTACTDGYNEWYSPEFIATLSDAEICGLILHECFHKMFRHMITWRHLWKLCPSTANQACDYVINLLINDICVKSNGLIALPEGGLLDERFRGMSAQEVFDILYQEKEQEGGNGKKGEQGDEASNPGKGQGESDNSESEGNDEKEDDGAGLDEHDWEGTEDMSDEEREEMADKIDEALRQGQMRAEQAGAEAGGLSESIGKLLTPEVDWKEAMRNFITATCAGNDRSTWRRPRRRMMASGIYMPSSYSTQVEEVMGAEDTSGSTSSFRTRFRTELQGIFDQVRPKTLHLVNWDTSVEQHEIIREGEPSKLESSPVRGGGGTDVTCLSKYLKKHKLEPKVLVILTDGYLSGGWGDWPAKTNVLWCIYDNPNARPPVGTTIHIAR